MSETTFCKAFLSALDSRPVKLSSDHIADARQYPSGAIFTLPRLPHPPHPQRPSASPSASEPTTSASSLTITLKPMKPTHPTVPLPDIVPTKTSIYDLKTSYSASTSLPASKIKILYKKKPVADSKTVAEVIGADAGSEVEFGVMVMGGAVAGGTPVASPPAVAPSEAEKGLAGPASGETEVEAEAEAEAGAGAGAGPAAQGPSGKEVVAGDEFWEDLKGFVLQRIRDEKEGERLVGLFKEAWEKDKEV
ncbi:hypothetical protein P280DRAFT_406367 [Massarina eburnea CBS 473.64]|uniref:Ubiquitin-like domain-containing protein n=1 Tax=Massarina eburnea CBS 473.64 TaxID=1395130 RepID=A0A6A6RV68_9PLEO|nr:hypothetical protein P280DRAFT_406367 [Massarina eburnea CBS 473.64]